MQDELISLQHKLKKTMVFITHDFLEAIKMGDHIAIMKDGEISQIGTPEEIVAAPANDYVREFTEDVPRYKVLSAGKVMRKVTDGSVPADVIPVRTSDKIEALIDRIAESDVALPVVDASNRLVGEIDRGIVMRAMQSRS
jgi:glycine betaine/proline transport system ATP-binding protein